jgi:hypothetical protein
LIFESFCDEALMRLVAHIPAKPELRVPAKRIIIATNPQNMSYCPPGWVIMFGGYCAEGEDGPSISASAYPTVQDALTELEEDGIINPSSEDV